MTVPFFEPRLQNVHVSEEELERDIKAASDRMCAAPERVDKLRHWREMCRLIDLRSTERVRFMERVRGLA